MRCYGLKTWEVGKKEVLLSKMTQGRDLVMYQKNVGHYE